MIKKYRLNKPITLLLGFTLSTTLLLHHSAAAEVAVIVNPANTSEFNKKTIKKIFLGKTKSFKNGRIAILLSPGPDTPARSEFNKLVLSKSSNQINAYWSKMIFTGKGVPPQEMKSASEIISAVAANQDTIAYIDAASVTDAVKVVAKF
jgi:ABC-type phosphate transport system substrate-binding protein